MAAKRTSPKSRSAARSRSAAGAPSRPKPRSPRKASGRPVGKRRAGRKPAAKAGPKHRPATPLLELAATWPFVSLKYMFGCNALLARGRLFFIEMDESIVIRVGKDRLAAALRIRGSEIWNPWTPGEPGDWVRFPPARRRIPRPLAGWARTAYQAALQRKPPPKKRPRGSRSARESPRMSLRGAKRRSNPPR